jgi:hypothetical protein
MSVAGKLHIANRLIEAKVIKTPEEYISFLDRDLDSEESLKLMYVYYMVHNYELNQRSTLTPIKELYYNIIWKLIR